MDFQYCPKCDAFNPPGVTHCEQCQAELPQVEDAVPVPTPPDLETAPADTPPGPGVAEPPAAPVPESPVPFDAPPEVLERIRHLDAAIERKPGATALHIQLAQLYADGQREDLAVRVLERYLEGDPRNAVIRHRLQQLGATPPASPAAVVSAPVTPVAPAANVGAPGPPGAPAARPQAPIARVARPIRPAYRPPPRRRRRSRKVVFAAAGGVLVLALAVKLIFFPGPKLVVGGAFSAVAPSWSPTGRQFAFVRVEASRSRLAVYDLRQENHRDLADLSAWDAGAFSWSPDGTRIAYVGGTERGWGESVFVVDVASGRSQRVTDGRRPIWAPDGRTLLMWCAAEGSAASAFAEDGELVDPGGQFAPGSFAPAGFCRVDADTGEVLQRAAPSDEDDLAFGWSAAVSSLTGRLAFEKAVGEPPPPPPSRSGDGEFVDMVDSVAARGARNIAEGSRDLSRELEARERDRKRRDSGGSGPARDVFVSEPDGSALRAITNDGRSGSPVWTRDGARILFVGEGGLWLMNPDGSGRERVFTGKLSDPPVAQLTADGRYVLFVAPVEASAGVAQLMTGETPEDLYVARVGSSKAKRLANRHPFKQRFALAPDGRRIVYEVLAETGTLTRQGGRSELWMMRW